MNFDKLTIIILASNEQESLRETLKTLAKCCNPEDIAEIIVYLKSEDCLAKKELEIIRHEEELPFPVREYVQTVHYTDEIAYESPHLVNSSHFIIIVADYEMDLHSIPELIKISKNNPRAIVCASKLKKGSVRQGYGFFHMICARFVNFIVKKIIGSDGTDLISIFEIYPMEVYKQMYFTFQRKSFYGFTIKPLIYGIPYIEIPVRYVKRSDGKTNLSVKLYTKMSLIFIGTAIRLRIKKEKDNRRSKAKND